MHIINELVCLSYLISQVKFISVVIGHVIGWYMPYVIFSEIRCWFLLDVGLKRIGRLTPLLYNWSPHVPSNFIRVDINEAWLSFTILAEKPRTNYSERLKMYSLQTLSILVEDPSCWAADCCNVVCVRILNSWWFCDIGEKKKGNMSCYCLCQLLFYLCTKETCTPLSSLRDTIKIANSSWSPVAKYLWDEQIISPLASLMLAWRLHTILWNSN